MSVKLEHQWCVDDGGGTRVRFMRLSVVYNYLLLMRRMATMGGRVVTEGEAKQLRVYA